MPKLTAGDGEEGCAGGSLRWSWVSWLTPDSFPGAPLCSLPTQEIPLQLRLFKHQELHFRCRLHRVWELLFFSPPSSKCFICSILLNHRHICTNDIKNSLLGFPHLNIKYSGLYIHACHLHGCLDSSHQWEQGRLPFICFLYRITKQFQRCSLQGKKYLQNMISNQQNSSVLGF